MLTERLQTSKYSLFDRLLALDYFLIFIVITIGSVSVFAIHSTESGEFSYYTKNHLIRLLAFFVTTDSQYSFVCLYNESDLDLTKIDDR